ncbi:MAG TPA: hypothetical protein VK886_22905 [Vicinamibacterales bacterium]|nr:hypothetical protein [Vicinamibacterales bacterium]
MRIGDAPARVVRASSSEIHVIVPGADARDEERSVARSGRMPVFVADAPEEAAMLEVGAPVATGLHMVDSPAIDRAGIIWATFSGTRSQQSAVTIYRVAAGRAREPFVTSIAHPTSLAAAPDGALYITDRFEGTLYRVEHDGRVETIASDLGVPCGLAFGPDGSLYVGDRSGRIIRLRDGAERAVVAALPPSVAAFHLAWGPDGRLYVTAPTLDTRDPVYGVTPDGEVEVLPVTFGRPQGLAFDHLGRLYVADALAGAAGIFRVSLEDFSMEKVVAAPHVVGLCFGPDGSFAVASADAIHRFTGPATDL